MHMSSTRFSAESVWSVPLDVLEHLVMVDPHDADRDEADGVTKVRGPEAEQRVRQTFVARDVRHTDLEHKQRDGDGKDAIAERLEPRRVGVMRQVVRIGTHRYSSSVLVSPSGSPSSRAFSSRRMILPERVFGSTSMKSISRGATPAPSLSRAKLQQLAPQLVRGLVAVLQRDERLDDLHRHRVRLADDAGFGHGGVLDQRALDLERADEVAGRVDHVVGAADEPEVAVLVFARAVAGDVPAVVELGRCTSPRCSSTCGTSRASPGARRGRPPRPAASRCPARR